MESLEYIDAYFGGEFSPEETGRFERRIQEDPVFAGEVAYYLGVLSAARESGREAQKARFRELYRERAASGRPAVVRKMIPRTWLVVTVAASILAAVVLTWTLYLKPADPARLAERYMRQNLTYLPVKMGGMDSLTMGIDLYNSGKFAEALRQFEGMLRLDSLNPAALNYAGIVSLRMENYDKAIEYFVRLRQHTDPHVNPSLFYEALAFMKRNHAGDADKAKQLLRQIVDAGLNKKADAQELLSNM
jgi:tetratricopeptide (TPR) repeat protein